ncbi:helix-turn-helix transcriptional regulator [Citrobacter meridianamericanus]|uniref:helix-turn-helix transcriptional regulator n=1 Tax=Citrobacter meridianamericanus TaxID=2894201 RepID=UPI0039BE4788
MDRDAFHRALIWVEENLCSGKGVNELVRATGCSRRTLEQGFQAHFGFSPGDYLFRRRMTRAAIMLRMTSLHITEIAVLLRYHSGQNFTRAFRRFFGVIPTDYRRDSDMEYADITAPTTLWRYNFACKNSHFKSPAKNYRQS